MGRRCLRARAGGGGRRPGSGVAARGCGCARRGSRRTFIRCRDWAARRRRYARSAARRARRGLPACAASGARARRGVRALWRLAGGDAPGCFRDRRGWARGAARPRAGRRRPRRAPRVRVGEHRGGGDAGRGLRVFRRRPLATRFAALARGAGPNRGAACCSGGNRVLGCDRRTPLERESALRAQWPRR